MPTPAQAQEVEFTNPQAESLTEAERHKIIVADYERKLDQADRLIQTYHQHMLLTHQQLEDAYRECKYWWQLFRQYAYEPMQRQKNLQLSLLQGPGIPRIPPQLNHLANNSHDLKNWPGNLNQNQIPYNPQYPHQFPQSNRFNPTGQLNSVTFNQQLPYQFLQTQQTNNLAQERSAIFPNKFYASSETPDTHQ